MSSLIRPHSNLFEVQRVLAAILFGLIFSAYLFAYLLYLFPGEPILWRLSVPINNLMQPVTTPIDSTVFADPKLLLPVFLFCMIAPLTPLVRRNWLATAAFGHVALAIGVIVVAGNFQLAFTTTTKSASTLPLVALEELGAGTWGLALTSLVLVVLCTLNHIAFFRAPSHH